MELFYHSVAMLSHKSHSPNNPGRATASHVRQSLSSVRVISILQNESPNDLPPLPIVPYAISTAMTVAYRQFRQSKLLSHRKRGKEDLKTCCNLLNRLRTSWWSAGAMADLGCAALKKAENQEKCDSNNTKMARGSKTNGDSATPTSKSLSMTPNTRSTRVPRPANSMGEVFPPANRSSIPGDIQGNIDDLTSYPLGQFNFSESPDWLNFDAAFENMDTLLGSSGADQCTELFKSFNCDSFNLAPV